jgi:hypothetical protein
MDKEMSDERASGVEGSYEAAHHITETRMMVMTITQT